MIDTMYVSDWLTLFEQMASNNKAISHDPNIDNNNVRFFADDKFFSGNELTGIAVVCSPPISKMIGVLDNALQNYDFELWFLKQCDKGDEVAMREAWRNGELLALDFISVLDFKSSSYNNADQRLLAGFKISDCTIDTIGPIGKNYFGAALTIKVASLRNLQLDDSRWYNSYNL